MAKRVPHVLLATLLLAGSAACSGGNGAPTASPAASASPVPSPTPEGAVSETTPLPGATATLRATTTPEPWETLGEGTRSGIRKIDADETGQLSLLGTSSIVVDTGGGAKETMKEARLTDDTVVLDVQGSVCAQGSVPHRCTSKQLARALKAGVSFYAKVLIADGDAVRVEEIVKN
ncbi:hypothetical protein GCM10017673_37160 [Streptosporangium violaceochromogenes]|nr:hypothetical protein GCM10017673_37160 [Streptosporangium violaceochromogenes]